MTILNKKLLAHTQKLILDLWSVLGPLVLNLVHLPLPVGIITNVFFFFFFYNSCDLTFTEETEKSCSTPQVVKAMEDLGST